MKFTASVAVWIQLNGRFSTISIAFPVAGCWVRLHVFCWRCFWSWLGGLLDRGSHCSLIQSLLALWRGLRVRVRYVEDPSLARLTSPERSRRDRLRP